MMTLLIASLGLHLAYYVLIFARLIWWRSDAEGTKTARSPLSILVCIKNEKPRINGLVTALNRQDVDEIVIVDDYSSDGSLELLGTIASKKIRVVQATADRPGKKHASADGIAACSYDKILFTDADCTPASDEWAQIMSASDRPIVLGYSPMSKTSSLVNLFARYETYMTGLQYLSYAAIGIPYMGVGRNMLIDTKILSGASAAIRGKHLASGDDDLTINAVATADNTAICIDPRAHVYTDSPKTWRAFVRQKTRHISTATYYRMHHQILLAAFSISQIAFYLFLFVGVISGTIPLQIGIALFIVKQLVQILVHSTIIRKLNESIAIHQLLFLDLLLFGYYLIMPLIILIHKKDNHWN